MTAHPSSDINVGAVVILPDGRYWRSDAACRTEDPELFFPVESTSPQWDEAKAICLRCPVREQCLADALAKEEGVGRDSRFGVVGGLTGRERWQAWRKANPVVIACGTPAGARQHRGRGEPLDEACQRAEARSERYRAYQRPTRACVDCGKQTSTRSAERCRRCSGRHQSEVRTRAGGAA